MTEGRFLAHLKIYTAFTGSRSMFFFATLTKSFRRTIHLHNVFTTTTKQISHTSMALDLHYATKQMKVLMKVKSEL
jgi:hypothetical protein